MAAIAAITTDTPVAAAPARPAIAAITAPPSRGACIVAVGPTVSLATAAAVPTRTPVPTHAAPSTTATFGKDQDDGGAVHVRKPLNGVGRRRQHARDEHGRVIRRERNARRESGYTLARNHAGSPGPPVRTITTTAPTIRPGAPVAPTAAVGSVRAMNSIAAAAVHSVLHARGALELSRRRKPDDHNGDYSPAVRNATKGRSRSS